MQQKLTKVKQRRDHYARLYYRTLAQLDETKWELATAKHTIHELQNSTSECYACVEPLIPLHTMSGATTTCSPDSGTWLSPSHSWKTRPAFTLSQTDTPPSTHRQRSASPYSSTPHRKLPTSFSVPSFSAFRPLKSSNLDMPAYEGVRGCHTLSRQELTGVELLDLLTTISAPHCSIHTLE